MGPWTRLLWGARMSLVVPRVGRERSPHAVSSRRAARRRAGPGPAGGRADGRRGGRRRRDPRRHRLRAARREPPRRERSLLARPGRLGVRDGLRACAGVPERQRRQPARGLPHRRRRELRAGLLVGHRAGLPRGADPVLHRPDADRLRRGHLRRRPVLLPARRGGLHRPELLRRAAHALRRQGRALRRGLRDRARVRPPRAAPARHRPEGRPLSPGGDVRLRSARAAGGLLRRRVGGARRGHGLHRGPHAGRHRRRAGRGRRRGRRPHPEGGDGSRGPRVLDARLGRRAPEVVQHRLSRGRPEGVRHVRRGRALGVSAGEATSLREDVRVSTSDTTRLAVLIDSDNTTASLTTELLEEIAKYGTPTIKRAYGDWTTQQLVGWKDELLRHAIQPVQQFGYTRGKNATDSALIIDAMDLLYAANVEGFAIVSSDSDFTRLATRLRESGMTVYGLGRRSTPAPFVAACDRFIYLDLLRTEPVEPADNAPEDREPASAPPDLKRVLSTAVSSTSEDDG